MLHDAGVLTLYNLVERTNYGAMPCRSLVEQSRHYYGEYTIGYNRQYLAKGANEQIDLIAEIDCNRAARIGQFATDRNGDQYRVDNVQHTTGDDGLAVTLLTLQRLGECYDIAM